MDAAIAFARNVTRTRFEDLPPAAVEVTKKDILDSLGVALAGSKAPGGRQAIQLAKRWRGKRESTIIADGSKVPSVNAAWANGCLVHALDYDDIHHAAVLHAGAPVVPAALAVAEMVGNVSGKEFITAVTLGIDLECRMGLAREGPRMWLLTQAYGVFGAAAAAGRLLGLDEEKLVDALGIAYFQASGNAQAITDAAIVRGIVGGFAAKGGVLAALLAQMNVTGPRNSLEGKFGLYRLYHQGQYNPQALTVELGKRFEGVNLSFKRYPCCARNHAFIEAALELKQKHGIRPEDVETVTLFVGKDAFDEVCDPVEIRRKPPTTVDAQLSALYTVALALAGRKINLGAFSPEAIKDPVVLGIAGKVTPHLDPALSRKQMEPAVVEVRLVGGKTVRASQMEWAYAESENPMPMHDLADKFRDCASHMAKPLAPDNIEKAIGMLTGLEELDDVSRVVRLLG
ncbi:MAG: MmgE/PrpD family protein [Chloroflexota bacterium]